MKQTDQRAVQLAQSRHRIVSEDDRGAPAWGDMPEQDRDRMVATAASWLRAAVETGIAPLAERPSDKHEAVYVDDEGFLYGEYRTVPESDSIVRLVWAPEIALSKGEMEEEGIELRLLGWSW